MKQYKKRDQSKQQLSSQDTRFSTISEAIRAKRDGDDVFTVGNMLGIAVKDPNIRDVAGAIVKRYGLNLNTDGLRIRPYFLIITLAVLHREIKDSRRTRLTDGRRIVVTDRSSLAVSKPILDLYALLLLAQYKKIVSGQFVYNDDFKYYSTYPYLSAEFARKHTPEIKSESKGEAHRDKCNSKLYKQEGLRVANLRNIRTSTSIKPTPEQMAKLNEEICQGNKYNLFNKIEAKFQSQASQEGKVVKSVFFKTTNRYSLFSFSTQNSAKGKTQCKHHNQEPFFFSTAKMGDTHYLYHYEGTSLKAGLIKGGNKAAGIEAYAEFVEPRELAPNYSPGT